MNGFEQFICNICILYMYCQIYIENKHILDNNLTDALNIHQFLLLYSMIQILWFIWSILIRTDS